MPNIERKTESEINYNAFLIATRVLSANGFISFLKKCNSADIYNDILLKKDKKSLLDLCENILTYQLEKGLIAFIILLWKKEGLNYVIKTLKINPFLLVLSENKESLNRVGACIISQLESELEEYCLKVQLNTKTNVLFEFIFKATDSALSYMLDNLPAKLFESVCSIKNKKNETVMIPLLKDYASNVSAKFFNKLHAAKIDELFQLTKTYYAKIDLDIIDKFETDPHWRNDPQLFGKLFPMIYLSMIEEKKENLLADLVVKHYAAIAFHPEYSAKIRIEHLYDISSFSERSDFDHIKLLYHGIFSSKASYADFEGGYSQLNCLKKGYFRQIENSLMHELNKLKTHSTSISEVYQSVIARIKRARGDYYTWRVGLFAKRKPDQFTVCLDGLVDKLENCAARQQPNVPRECAVSRL